MSDRREFLTRFSAVAALAAFDVDELRASTNDVSAKWDLSWVDKISKAKYPVAWNAYEVGDGLVLELVKFYQDHYREIYPDARTLPVVVFRKVGTATAYSDAIWAKYGLGEVEKVNDPATSAPAQKNIFAPTVTALQERGMIPLVCNVALGFYARRLAAKVGAKPEDVANELRASLLPGATLVISGIFALTRAQHAGAVYMLGS